jgi:hypothetical protein
MSGRLMTIRAPRFFPTAFPLVALLGAMAFLFGGTSFLPGGMVDQMDPAQRGQVDAAMALPGFLLGCVFMVKGLLALLSFLEQPDHVKLTPQPRDQPARVDIHPDIHNERPATLLENCTNELEFIVRNGLSMDTSDLVRAFNVALSSIEAQVRTLGWGKASITEPNLRGCLAGLYPRILSLLEKRNASVHVASAWAWDPFQGLAAGLPLLAEAHLHEVIPAADEHTPSQSRRRL